MGIAAQKMSLPEQTRSNHGGPVTNRATTHNVRANTIANLCGRAVTAISGLAFVPLFVRYLGPEVYGLVAFAATVQTLVSLSDLGLSGAFAREVARLSVSDDKSGLPTLTRTLELVFLGIASTILAAAFLLSPIVASHWLRFDVVSVGTVRTTLRIAGVLLASQLLVLFYQSGLQGLGRQVLLNSVNASAVALRGGIAVLLLAFVVPSPVLFFCWQAVASVIQALVLRSALWRKIRGPLLLRRFDLGALLSVGRFALGVTGIAATGLVLMQLDRVLLSRLVPLDRFGHYALAFTAASLPILVSGALKDAVYPRFSILVAQRRLLELSEAYHAACRTQSVVVLPISVVIAVYSDVLVRIWTGDEALSAAVHPLVRILVVGTTLVSVLNLPFALQLAFGWTRLSLWSNILSMPPLIVLIFVLTYKYGVLGASAVWTAVFGIQLLVTLPVMHRHLLPGELFRWYRESIAIPGVTCVCIALLLRHLRQEPSTTTHGIVTVMSCWLTCACTTSLISWKAVQHTMRTHIHGEEARAVEL